MKFSIHLTRCVFVMNGSNVFGAMEICFMGSFEPLWFNITKTCLFKYTESFSTKKWKFQIKNSDIFHISIQNVDCGYSLEPP